MNKHDSPQQLNEGQKHMVISTDEEKASSKIQHYFIIKTSIKLDK
jgi:hypothetical protein